MYTILNYLMLSYIDLYYPILLHRTPSVKTTTTTCSAAWSKVPNKKKQQQHRLLGGHLNHTQSGTRDMGPKEFKMDPGRSEK